MAVERKKPTGTQKAKAWMDRHNLITCIGIACVVCASIVGLFAFTAFSGFGASADFIYNQF